MAKTNCNGLTFQEWKKATTLPHYSRKELYEQRAKWLAGEDVVAVRAHYEMLCKLSDRLLGEMFAEEARIESLEKFLHD